MLTDLLESALIIEIPITIKRYVICLIGMASVRYLKMPNTANSPKANPICIGTFLRRKHIKKVRILNMIKVKT
jgi:hypothetical protein